MSENQFRLPKAPIIEAVLDIDCDMPPGNDIAKLESPAHELLREHYPNVRPIYVQTHQIQTQKDQPPQLSVQQAVQALQFMHQGEKQIVQFRAQGYSFNRLAPYTNLDDYLPEIERTWKLFINVAAPTQIRTVRLRYINRILIPMPEGQLDLGEYLTVGPRLPDETRFTFTGFLNQYTAVENETGNHVSIVLTTQPPENPKQLSLIFDITVANLQSSEVENWTWLLARVQALRGLKNRVFRDTLTEKCLTLFQQP